jgi:chromosomal replication initiator protein
MLATDLSHTATVPSLWDECLKIIEKKIGHAHFETWFRTTELSVIENDCASILVPNRFFADFIEEHFSSAILSTLSELKKKVTTLKFIPTQKDWHIVEPISEILSNAPSRTVPHSIDRPEKFNKNYTFEKFVVGDSNRMAHAASLAVAEAPGQTTFNPLIIYGGTGLGKTHLLQAIGYFASVESTAENIVYMTSEEFTSQYISYVIEKKDSTSFYKQFNDVDLLLIDDIHFLKGKSGTQKEFYRIFNKLLLENKQIVLTSDRPPDKIPDMMEHIINRFMGGLITDIQPPNLETRMAILRKKAEIDGIPLPDEVVHFIAGHSTSNVRELEGILIKLFASSSFTGRDITIEVAREICGDIISRKQQRLSIAFIQQRVAETFSLRPNQLTAHTRKRDVAFPRAVAMYLCKKWTKQSLRTIGLDFGGRDYSTVIYASKKIETEIEKDSSLRERIASIEELIRPLA